MARKLALLALEATEGPWQRATGYESHCEVIGAEVTLVLHTSSEERMMQMPAGLSPMPTSVRYRFIASSPSSVYVHLT